MRIRKLLAAAALALVFVAGGASHAAAEETPTGAEFESPEAKECFDKLEAGKSVDDCQEAPSPILPATNELIWGIISFSVLFVVLAKLGYPAVRKGMEARTERIRSDLASAEQKDAEAQEKLDEYKSQLAEAKNESGRIIEEARQTADTMRRDLEARAQADIAELRTRAQADVEAAKVQAIADLRAQVADLAINAAEMIVQSNLDHDTQVRLIENYINQVGSPS